MKKGQFIGSTVFYVLVALIILLVLVFSYTQIQKLTGFAQEGQLKIFISTLGDEIEKQASGRYGGKGSMKEEKFSLPKDVESVCFVDRSKEIDFLVNNELNSHMKRFNESNVFFKPFNRFAPHKVDYLALDEETNPLCVNAVNSRISLRLVNAGRGKAMIEARQPKEMGVECRKKIYHGDKKLDIVFLPYGYDDKEDFSADVDYYIENIFMRVEPFRAKINSLNFYMIDVFADIGCSIGSWVKCDDLMVKQLASNCPNDLVVVLVERSKVADFLSPVRSSASLDTAVINTADDKLVLAHELGHMLAKLADEYVDEASYRGFFNEEDYANCDTEGCSEWLPKVYGTGCFKGCSLGVLYRPTEDSIMRSFATSFFGPVNAKELNKAIGMYD